MALGQPGSIGVSPPFIPHSAAPAAASAGGPLGASYTAPQGFCIAFDDPTLEENPRWTRIDDPAGPFIVSGWSIERGRSYELEKTGTGTATVTLADLNGDFDPTNSSGAFYGKLDPLKQAALALQNPVTGAWTTIYRGFIEDWDFEVDVSETVTSVTISLVDAFDILAAAEVIPDVYGTTIPTGSEGDVFYAAQQVDDRIRAALADANWPSGLTTIFSGNVAVQDTVYAPRSQILTVIQDAADAEFPGVANVYVSKDGKVTFHGRLARFNPMQPSYGINAWHCGDKAAADAAPTTTAPISELKFNRGLSNIINAALATPKGIADADIAGQLVTDSGSIDTYGVRSWSAEGLVTFFGDEAGSPDANDETKKFPTYYTSNYQAARTRINQLKFRPQAPTSTYGPAWWALVCGVEIGDTITVTTTHPGGGGFNLETFFIEGIHYDALPMNTSFHEVTLTLDVSPQGNFTSNPF